MGTDRDAGLWVVTGSTGYQGWRLVPALLAEGYRVRCLVRHPDKLAGIPWAGQVDVVKGDVTDPDRMRHACAGADIVYFLGAFAGARQLRRSGPARR